MYVFRGAHTMTQLGVDICAQCRRELIPDVDRCEVCRECEPEYFREDKECSS